jgi:hypothetical protein
MTRSPQSPGSTFFDHTHDDRGGRFSEAARRERMANPQVIGAEPAAQYPKLPASWSGPDLVGVEPPVDMSDECGLTFGVALGEPHEQPAPAPRSPAEGAEEAPTIDPIVVEDTPPRAIKRRV